MNNRFDPIPDITDTDERFSYFRYVGFNKKRFSKEFTETQEFYELMRKEWEGKQ